MVNKSLLISSLSLIFAFPSTVIAQEYPSILECETNAVATRDFAEPKFNKNNLWTGPIPGDSGDPFGIVTLENKTKHISFVRKRIFAGLNTEKPMVKTIREIFDDEGGDVSSESHGQVLNRSRDSAEIVLVWGHNQKWWLAIIDLSLKKVAIGHVFRGVTSIGGQLQTLDCH